MEPAPPTIHVDYRPEDEMAGEPLAVFEPVLFYRNPTEHQLSNLEQLRTRQAYAGELPDGWVLHYEASWCDDLRGAGEPPGVPGSNPQEYVTGIVDLTAVDEAVTAAQGHLMSMGYLHPEYDPATGTWRTARGG